MLLAATPTAVCTVAPLNCDRHVATIVQKAVQWHTKVARYDPLRLALARPPVGLYSVPDEEREHALVSSVRVTLSSPGREGVSVGVLVLPEGAVLNDKCVRGQATGVTSRLPLWTQQDLRQC